VSGPAYPADGDQRVRDGFRARLGQTVDITVDHVDAIPAEGSGKFRYVVSRVAA